MASLHLAIDYTHEQPQARLASGLQHNRLQLRRRMAATSSQVSGAKYMTITAGAMAITGLSMTDLKRRLVARLQTHRKFTENSRISQCLEICRQITSSFFPSYSVHMKCVWHVQSYTLAAVQIASEYGSERCVCEPIDSPSPASFLSRSRADCVEKMLAASILCKAVEDLQKFHSARHKVGQMLYQEVSHWITSNDDSSPYSFLNLCKALDLSPGRLRGELLAGDSSSPVHTRINNSKNYA